MPKRIRPHVNPLSITKEYSFEGFGNTNPIIVDVGACKGEFVEALLKKFPEKNYILFEVRTPLAIKLQKKFESFENVMVFDGDAGRNFKSILGPSVKKEVKIETIYINFPDPWFKERHKKRRFLNEKFLIETISFLPLETEFVFQTDQKFLFDETLEMIDSLNHQIPGSKALEPRIKASGFGLEFFDSPPFGIQTDWEQAKRKEGDAIYRVKFSKKGMRSK